jgi:hypothetical protein
MAAVLALLPRSERTLHIWRQQIVDEDDPGCFRRHSVNFAGRVCPGLNASVPCGRLRMEAGACRMDHLAGLG